MIHVTMLFGEGDTTSSQMIEAARVGREKIQFGKGTNVYDFRYIGTTKLNYSAR
jgi:hypothetical protein